MSTVDQSATSATVGEVADAVAKVVLEALGDAGFPLERLVDAVWDGAPAGDVLADRVTALRKGDPAAGRAEQFVQDVLAAAPIGVLEEDVKVRVKFSEVVPGAKDGLVILARDGKSARTEWVPPKPK